MTGPFTFDPAAVARVRKNFRGGLRFRLILLTQLPMGFLAGLRLREIDDERCRVSVRYSWLNRNPFRSTYWAVLGMAAEMASGALLLQFTHGQTPSVATLITSTSAKFLKKAVGTTTFFCESGRVSAQAVREAAESGEAREIVSPVRGVAEDGQPVAEFVFTWSVKARRPATEPAPVAATAGPAGAAPSA